MAVGLYLMDREEGVNIYKMDTKKRINSLSKIDKILKVSQTRSPLLIRACILQQACYNVVSVSIHHWFTIGLVTTWFLFLYTTGLQQAWLQCGFCFYTGLQWAWLQCGFYFYTPLIYNRLGYNVVSVSRHHWFATGLVTMWFLFLYWFTVGLVTMWFLFLYTTGLQQAWLQCGFCF